MNYDNACFEFKQICVGELEKALGNFKTSAGFGADGLASQFVKIGLTEIAESLCNIFNLSITTGRFPDSWKIAHVPRFLKAVKKLTGLTTDRCLYFHFCR